MCQKFGPLIRKELMSLSVRSCLSIDGYLFVLFKSVWTECYGTVLLFEAKTYGTEKAGSVSLKVLKIP